MENKKKTNVKVTKDNEKAKLKKSKERVMTDLEGNVIHKDKTENQGKKGVLKEHLRKYRKLYKKLILVLCVIVAVIALCIGVRNYVINKIYRSYEEKMEAYGFSILYDNESAKSSEKVTRLEMVKIILSSIYNKTEVESIGFGPQGIFDGDEWAKTAEAFEVIDKGYITKDNYDEIATYKEAITIYLNARNKLMDIPISNTKESSFKNLQSYSQEERNYINDATENGLIKDNKKNLKLDNRMFKGQFNELVVRFVEKYNTLAPEGDTIVTKDESKPSNYEIYPYILYSVEKEAYEYKGVNEDGVDYKTPVETYMYKKDYYSQMQYRTEDYYNTILNIDYRTVNKDEFLEKTDRFLRYDYSDSIKEYIDYVKTNKIVIEGKATVQLPVFYLDGIRYRARVKLSFEIKNSDTDKNILLGDITRNTEVTYANKKYEIYIDAPMGTTLLSKSLMLDMEPIIDIMVSNQEASALSEF